MKHSKTCAFCRRFCERNSADDVQRSPTSARPSRGAAASKAAGARRSGTMKVRGKHGRGMVHAQRRKASPGARPKLQ